jgi:hypothetical protein
VPRSITNDQQSKRVAESDRRHQTAAYERADVVVDLV